MRPESTSKANEDLTWPSLLLTSNIYILGFGFGLDEIDLWHLLHLRSIRLANKQESERNRIRFYNLYPSGGDSFKISNSAQYQLFSTYGVDVINVPVLNGDYEDAYRTAIDLIADHLPVASPHANE